MAALKIFSKGKVLKFIENYSEMSPKFSKMINEIMNWLQVAINTEMTKGAWGEDYKTDMEKTLKLLTTEDEGIKVFNYMT